MFSNMFYAGFYDTIEQLVRLDMSSEALLTSLLFSAAGALLILDGWNIDAVEQDVGHASANEKGRKIQRQRQLANRSGEPG